MSQQAPGWPGLGIPVMTTYFQWFYAGPQGPAANDEKK